MSKIVISDGIKKTTKMTGNIPILNTLLGNSVIVAFIITIIMIIIVMFNYPANSDTSIGMIFKIFLYMLLINIPIVFLHNGIVKKNIEEEYIKDKSDELLNPFDDGEEKINVTPNLNTNSVNQLRGIANINDIKTGGGYDDDVNIDEINNLLKESNQSNHSDHSDKHNHSKHSNTSNHQSNQSNQQSNQQSNSNQSNHPSQPNLSNHQSNQRHHSSFLDQTMLSSSKKEEFKLKPVQRKVNPFKK